MHRDYDNKFLLGISLLSIFDNPDLKFKQGIYIPVYFFYKTLMIKIFNVIGKLNRSTNLNCSYNTRV